MLKLGIIGLNEGNGHPFSYAAIFNGYDPQELQKRCPFALIKEYLPRDHRNENALTSAKVTHIWTQDKKISEDVAKVSLIPNIVDNYTDLIGKVDAVILARDDPWNHLEMARPFLEEKMPIFIDKQLVATKDELKKIMALTGPAYPLMAGSPMRFTRDVALAKDSLRLDKVKTIHGVSRVSWLRYGHHLFEGIAPLWGLDIEWVRSLSEREDHDIVQIHYCSGLNIILEFIPDVLLPIQFTTYSNTDKARSVPFEDFFYSFREMLKAFVNMVETGKKTISYEEIIDIAKVVLAGDISKKEQGALINPKTLEPLN
ncbi:MAG: hypothetical protein Q8Q23_04700 [bacterium]|nr:hypothetical protein [bacterium]